MDRHPLHAESRRAELRAPVPCSGRYWALAWVGLGLVVLVAYSNTFSVPFLLDDLVAIRDNATLRDLSDLGAVLNPPPEIYTSGRPLLNLTFAVNHAIGGEHLAGYHWLNLVIHVSAGFLLGGIITRTLSGNAIPASLRQSARSVGIAVAAVWLLHPLQTESVTYLSQRAESLMGLFYLLCLWSFVRSVTARKPGGWLLVSVMSCWLGMATKEVMVSAPVVIALYDRAFVSGSFSVAWRRRWWYYVSLAASWIGLGALMISTHIGTRLRSFESDLTWTSYALTECRAVWIYLGQAFAPYRLTFDYGWQMRSYAGTAGVLVAAFVGVVALVTIVLTAKRVRLGFPLAGFWVLLAPTSSVIPIAGQPMAESRMYLPLAAILAMGVVGVFMLIPRQSRWICAAVAGALGMATFARNADYRSEVAIWSDTVVKQPDNARARGSLGVALLRAGSSATLAAVQLREAVRLAPKYPVYYHDLALAVIQGGGDLNEAVGLWEKAIALNPNYLTARLACAEALISHGRTPEGIDQYEAALRTRPGDSALHSSFGNALSNVPGRLDDAYAQYREALRLNPRYAPAEYNFGFALFYMGGRPRDAIPRFEAALQIDPSFALAHFQLAKAMLAVGGSVTAVIEHLEKSVEIAPEFADGWNALGQVYAMNLERRTDAIRALRHALQLNPRLESAQATLAQIQR